MLFQVELLEDANRFPNLVRVDDKKIKLKHRAQLQCKRCGKPFHSERECKERLWKKFGAEEDLPLGIVKKIKAVCRPQRPCEETAPSPTMDIQASAGAEQHSSPKISMKSSPATDGKSTAPGPAPKSNTEASHNIPLNYNPQKTKFYCKRSELCVS